MPKAKVTFEAGAPFYLDGSEAAPYGGRFFPYPRPGGPRAFSQPNWLGVQYGALAWHPTEMRPQDLRAHQDFVADAAAEFPNDKVPTCLALYEQALYEHPAPPQPKQPEGV